MRTDSIFQIMSMTKPVTGVGIMMLAEDGRLGLLDPVEKHLPEFKGQKVRVRAGEAGPDSGRLVDPERPITIRDLMTHTSGMGDYPAALEIYTKMSVSLEDAVKAAAAQPLLFQPGERWSYSNPGIATLGRIIEVVSGQRYEDFLKARLFDPLKMNDTFFFAPGDKTSRIALVYRPKDGRLERSPPPSWGATPRSSGREPCSRPPSSASIRPRPISSVSTRWLSTGARSRAGATCRPPQSTS
jgi:CubicO group peptidase (beta-lactamase class C family)